ncbi:microfibril associated protein 5 [Cololabis saira]|uniref:microfibril associated protein 5 n=1 Tax=Cololabis saira TaxID=129043 RepID=UPI002AD4BBC9|nr:microfibril associated protein 5 [Cololabis saira]
MKELSKEEKHICRARKVHLLQAEGMGSLPVVLLLCGFYVLTAVTQAQQTESTEAPGDAELPTNCREEMYPCTRMYSVHKPIKRCIGYLCLYSLPRVYVINNEICMRTVCQQDEYLKAELCRELSGWPRRIARSSTRKRCRGRRSNPKTWANKA